MITTDLISQPPTAIIQNPTYPGFLADLATLNSMSPMPQGTVQPGGWTNQGAQVAFINGQYTATYTMLFSWMYNRCTYVGPKRLALDDWNGI